MSKAYSIHRQLAVLIAILALAVLPASATTRSVPSQYSTVQAAINAAASGDTIAIANGTYTGPFTVPSSKSGITIQGASNTSTILVAGQNQVTLTVSATDVTIKNIELKNSYTGDNNTSQVLIITAARCAIRSCNLIGRQDTLYAKGASTSVFVTGSEIDGDVDFVYGQGRIFVTGCTIRQIRGNGGTIGAPQTAQSQNYGIVFSSCTITSGGTAGSDSSYLGRPWGAYGELAFINCSIGSVIEPVGYINWTGTSNSSTCRFAEYPCPSSRASWVKRLTSSQAAAYTESAVLNGWNP
ncbi:MAG TPA: pectinesterase family protein [Verrucomicrobiae bacterium]|nr:pectinesterase family protein [Verrucomicrobiae bacterium]